ncbi:5-(carboxyamino)imidazole ribonucleotide synthase [Patulibacter minatonensis]|uniref:5-(carboxyamino)imidazole ribonucleotide synthase n=1 Tax=Patulibacter minatonensis TaxID=298163 RepID=UPI000685A3D6|nr:5-(carboxyamino)imidazole ribonucleotide synthase [Patulibacter minatonensis]
MAELLNPRPTPPDDAPRRPRLGVLGAGQLARMDQQAAIALDVDLRLLADGPGDAAVLAGAEALVGDHGDLDVLRAFASGVDVVTFEFEGVDNALLQALVDEGHRLVPAPTAKLFAQDKLHQRRGLGDAGFPVPPFEQARTPDEVAAFAATHGWPVVLKAPRGGYDGRGVGVVDDVEEAAAFLEPLPDGALVEPKVVIEREIAVQVARTSDGRSVAYPVVETVQHEAMLRELVAPAEIPEALAREAVDLAVAIVDHIGATGLVAVELFVTPDGLRINELAMRPHNSGHYSIEGAVTSQFEQHLRAALDWPLGSTALVAPAAVTVNVVGPEDGSDPRSRLRDALAVVGAHVHLYGKGARAGRKLGHVTALGPDVATAKRIAWRAVDILEGRA